MYFFFQAEDGIRDLYVTGVQTCALPICPASRRRSTSSRPVSWKEFGNRFTTTGSPSRGATGSATCPISARRSEERRVGKECRDRLALYYAKQKKYAN